jgi:hypothetical protein
MMVIREDRLASVASGCEVVEGARVFYAERTGKSGNQSCRMINFSPDLSVHSRNVSFRRFIFLTLPPGRFLLCFPLARKLLLPLFGLMLTLLSHNPPFLSGVVGSVVIWRS